MKSQLLLIAVIVALLSLAHTQHTPQPMVYEPFSQEELSQVNGAYKTQETIIPNEPEAPNRDHHHKKKHDKRPHPQEVQALEETEYEAYLTEQQKQERRMERIRYNKLFRWGMIFGTAVLAIIICKTCVAKRRRTCAMMRQRRQQQIQMQEQHLPMQQPYVYNLSAHPYPINQPVQMARPYYQEPQVVRVPCQPRAVQPQIVRGRPHESFIKEQTQTQSIEEQIRYHQNVIMTLKEQKRREESESRRKMVPMHTTESIESCQPIRRNRQIPVGQPVYERDANSSFASEYPEI